MPEAPRTPAAEPLKETERKPQGISLGVALLLKQICLFGRNVIVARVLSTAQMGFAASLGMVVYLFEMATNMALQRLLIQVEEGQETELQATIHLVNVVRGFLLAALIVLAAGPIGHLLDAEEQVWAFQLLALIPAIKGFVHTDYFRMQRYMRFRPAGLAETGPEVLVIAVALPVALWLRDYRVMLVLFLVQAVTMTVLSHVVAELPYRIRHDRALLGRLLRFGWPLLLNGMVLYGVFWGERWIVAHFWSKETLGVFHVAAQLAIATNLAATAAISQWILPLFSHRGREREKFAEMYRLSLCYSSLFMLIAIPGFMILGGPIVIAIFGAKYNAAGDYIVWLGLAACVRIMMSSPAMGSISKADSFTGLLGNLMRATAIPIAFVAALQGYGLIMALQIGVVGEIAALIVMNLRIVTRHGVPAGKAWGPLVAFAAIGLAILFPAWHYTREASVPIKVTAYLLCSGASALALCALFPQLRHDVLQRLRRGKLDTDR